VDLDIHPVRARELEATLDLVCDAIRAGDAYAFAPETPRQTLREYWFQAGALTYAAIAEGDIVGTFTIRANQPGAGAHVANGAFVVAAAARGGGIGRQMGERAISAAREAGFRAMQFNFVVSTNVAAVRLWRSLGFEIVGRLPKAFVHPQLGAVDALVMYRFLTP